MAEITRRDALLATATGVAALGVARPAAAEDKPAGPSPRLLDAVRKQAEAMALDQEPKKLSPPKQADVRHCRSWTNAIYLYISEDERGFVYVNDLAFAIAAACQATGKKVTVRHWGHDSKWGGGAGLFDGALLEL